MVAFAPFWSQSYSQPSQLQLVGTLHEKNGHGDSISIQKVHAHQEIIIGRDPNRCQHVVRDAVVSNKQLRIYTVIFDDDQPDGIPPLVYAEDLSRNGTYWNGSLIGKGNGGILLSDGDILRVSPRIYYQYHPSTRQKADQSFDLTQECEMKHFEKDYNVSDRKLGSGACGEVFMATEQSRRTQLACKIVDLRKLKSSPRTTTARLESPAAAEDVDSRVQMVKIKSWATQKQKETRLAEQLKVYHREATILASLSHPNIIGIEKVYVTDNSIYIFQDLVTGGDLFSFLERKNGKLSDVEAAVIVRQIVIALDYLHEKNIVHRDLKPENILMTSLANGCRVVLTDFGHAKKIDNDRTRMTTMAGTEQYIAPEISGVSRHFKGKNGYTKAVDIWSLGCITVVLLTGGSPFVNRKTNQYCQELARKCDLKQLDDDAEWQLVGKRPKDFVKRLLVLDEEQRMSVKEAKRHSWFSNYFHRVDFEEVYHRATKNWRSRTLKTPVIEMIDASQLRELPWLHKADPIGQRNNRRRSLVPMDPPYKPYPRRMSLSLLPRRRIGQSFTMSDEVRIAIEEKWSPGKGHARAFDAEPDQVPALIPDVESNDLDQPLSEPRTPEACNQSLFHTSSPAFTSPFRLLVKAQSSMSKQTIPKSSPATEVSTDKAKANRALPKAICSKDAFTVPITERESGEPAQMTRSPALTADRTTSDGATCVGKETVNAEDGEHAARDEDTADGAADLSHREQAMIAEHSSDIAAWDPDNKSKPRPRGRNLKVNKCEPSSQTATISPAKESNNKGSISAAYSAQVGLDGIDMERPTLKLRSRLPTHLKTASERPSNPKKRRGSIYDLEEDDCADQTQRGLRKTKLGSDGMNLQPGSAWKKPKISHNQGAQKIVHSESRLDLRGGGGFSTIRDGFMDFYFP